jgi:hypothetical protein
MTTQTTKQLTLGEKRCHIGFNPSSDDRIGTFKRMMADAIDFCYGAFIVSDDKEAIRCFEIAMEHLETAQMYCVKGISKELSENKLPSLSTIGVGHLTIEGRKEE